MSDDSFNLKEIVEASVSALEDFPDVVNLLIEKCEDELSSRLTPAKLRDVADELLSEIGDEDDKDQ